MRIRPHPACRGGAPVRNEMRSSSFDFAATPLAGVERRFVARIAVDERALHPGKRGGGVSLMGEASSDERALHPGKRGGGESSAS